jgi:hypothetical protein
MILILIGIFKNNYMCVLTPIMIARIKIIPILIIEIIIESQPLLFVSSTAPTLLYSN